MSRGKDVSIFEKGQIIGMHQAEKSSKEIAETTKTGLRTVQRIIKNWKDSGDPSSARKKCGRKKILNDRDRRSLKCLVKSNGRKTKVELRAMFNSESKSISTRTMRRELKGMGLNCYVALGKPVIIESYRKNHPTFTQDDPGSSPCWGEMSKDHLSVQKYKRQTPPWKRRLEAQIKTARREVSQLSEAKKGNMKKQVPKRYSQMPIDEALETAKQRLQTLASRLKRYSRENEAKRLNHPVSSQPAHMYAQEQGNNIRGDILRPDTEQQTDCEPPPNSQDSGWTGDLEGETTCRGARADQQMEPGCSSGVHNDGEWHP